MVSFISLDFLAKTASDQGYSYTLTNKQKIIDNLIEQSGNVEFFRAAVQNGLLNNPQNADSFISEYAKTPQEQSDLKSFFDKAVLETRKDAYISGKNITLNMNSPKYMEVVVGHEITHSFEGSDLYEPMKQILFQIAKDKGEYDSRLKSIQQRYTDKDGKFIGDDNGDPEAAYQRELVADLVGEYLFKDESFVRRLSTENRNVFQKVYDKIKYLYRLATAGSKEARQLEKVKTTFEKIYREGAQGVEGTKHSIAKTQNMSWNYQLVQIEKGRMNGSNSLYIGKPSNQLQTAGFSDSPFAMNQSDYRKSRREAGNNKHYSSHSVPYDFFENMPQYLADAPILIDNGGRVTVITSYGMKDTNGNDSFVIAGILQNQKMNNDTVNLVKSVYPWDDFAERIRNNAENGKLIVINKNKAEQMLATIGVQPSELSSIISLAKGSLSQQNPGVKGKYSLSPAEAVIPTNGGWNRGASTDEVRAKHPTLYAVDEDATEKRNPTQVKGTIGSYRNVYDYLQNEGFNGSILDASSGLGYGTKAGIEDCGLDVEDIEPYPDKNYKPKYTDYSTLNKKYDAIISNAVLNVLPQDQRDALVVKMGELLNDGGRMFVNVRGKDVLNASGKIAINEQNMEYFIPRTAKTGSYQKGFTKPELVAYLQDALGDVYTVKPTNMFGAVSAIVEKNQAKYSLSDSDGKALTKGQQEYFANSKMRDDEGRLKPMYHGSQDAGFHVFDSDMSDDGRSFFFTDSTDVASSYSGSGEIYEARAIRTTDDFVNFLTEIGESDYEVTGNEDSGYFVLDVDGDTVAESGNLQDLYTEFCDYMGIGYGDANYKVYLNLTNPLIVDAEGRNWDNVTSELSEEIVQNVNSLTEEEKAALTDLAGWDDISTFRHEILSVKDDIAPGDAYRQALSSAYNKLFEVDTPVSVYSLFNMASDNFSEDSIVENAEKTLNTRDHAQWAKANGYDGVIFKNIVDYGQYGGDYNPATVAVAFDSEQIKSTANENPTKNKDTQNLPETPVAKQGEMVYNEANKGGGSNAADEFGRLQEAVRGMSEEESESYHTGSREITEGVRDDIARVLRARIESGSDGLRNGDGLLKAQDTKTGNQFNIHKNVSAELFHDVFEIARSYLPNGELVDLHGVQTTEDGIGYDECNNFLSEDGMSGFSITPDGDLISVFNLGKQKGFLRAIRQHVLENAKTLDCYNSPKQPLTDIYEAVFGMKTAAVMDYNMEYDHDNIAKNHNMPPVAFMVNTDQDVPVKHFTKDQYDEAKAYRDSFINKAGDDPASSSAPIAPQKIMGQDVPPPPTAKKKVPKKRAQDVPPPPTARKKADAEGNGAKLPPVADKQQGSSSTMADSQNSGYSVAAKAGKSK